MKEKKRIEEQTPANAALHAMHDVVKDTLDFGGLYMIAFCSFVWCFAFVKKGCDEVG